MYYISQSDRANQEHAFGPPDSTRSAHHTSKIQLFPFKENISFSSPQKKNSAEANGTTSTTMASHSLVYNTYSHTPIKTPPTLSNSFTGSQGTVNSYSLPYGLLERKSPKPKNACMNFTHFDDADIEEFNEKIEKPSKVAFKSTNAPFASPKKKSLLGITELHSSPLKLIPTVDVLSFEDNKTTESIGTDDETDIQQPEGFDDNMDDISNLSMIHNFDARFEQSRYRAESIRRKHTGERSKTTLMNEVILDNILEFLDGGDLINFSKILYSLGNIDQYKVKIRQLLREVILNGMNDQEQYSFWNAYINFTYLKQNHSTSFAQNFVRKCSYIKDIKMDLDRTLPEYEKYSTDEGKNELLKVLVAVSNSNKGVGYIQGLNSIAGVFLFYLKEEQAFWATLYILEKLKIKDLLKEDFQTIYTLNYQFKTFLENYMPEIVEHLKFQAINLEYITTPWFITLFSYFLPLPKIVKLWNFFFLKGIGFFIQFGLAVFAHYKNQIMEMEPDEVPTFLKEELRELADDDDSLFEKALEFKVTKRLMLELLTLYHQGKPQAKLCKDGISGKLKWEAIPSVLNTELSIPIKTVEKLETCPAESKVPSLNQKTITSVNETQVKDSPFKFEKFFNAIIPGTLKNIFSKNKNPNDDTNTPRDLSQRNEKPENVQSNHTLSSPDKNQFFTPPKRINMDMIDNSPENVKSHDKTPHITFFHDSYSRNNRGMLESLDTEDVEQNILYTVRTEANEQINNSSFYDPQKSARAKSLFLREPVKLGRSVEGKESPRQISLSKFYEIARMINGANPDYEHRILTGISLPKIESTTTVDDVSIHRRVVSSSPHAHFDKDASLAYYSTGYNYKFT